MAVKMLLIGLAGSKSFCLICFSYIWSFLGVTRPYISYNCLIMSATPRLILPVVEFRKTSRYCGLMAVMIFCWRAYLTPCTSRKTQSHSLCWSHVVFGMWSVVPTGITRGPGWAGLIYAALLCIAYSLGVTTRPRCPWAPPPRSECTHCALIVISCWSILIDSKVGSPCILVRLVISKTLFW